MNKDKVTTVIEVNEKFISTEISKMKKYDPVKIRDLLSSIEQTLSVYNITNYLNTEQLQIVAKIAQKAIAYHIYKKWSISIKFYK